MDENRPYLVPRSVRARLEIIAGLGLLDLLAVAIAGGLGFLMQLGWSHLPLHTPALRYGMRACLFGFPPAAIYMAVKPDVSGFRLFDQLRAWRDYGRKPHRYLYRRTGTGS